MTRHKVYLAGAGEGSGFGLPTADNRHALHTSKPITNRDARGEDGAGLSALISLPQILQVWTFMELAFFGFGFEAYR